jgi:hypothetical protein
MNKRLYVRLDPAEPRVFYPCLTPHVSGPAGSFNRIKADKAGEAAAAKLLQ